VPGAQQTLGGSPFVQALSQANAGTYARDPGWTVLREESEAVVVTRGGLSLWASPAEVYPRNGGGVSPGAPVGVLMPKELLRLAPGFYMALGDAEFPVDASEPIVRLYWNLRSEGAVPLVGLLTQRMNAEGLPFRLKVLSDPAQYSRCDAGVLYAPAADYEAVARVVAVAYEGIAGALKTTTPALTKELAPGLGLAEDPGGLLSSFGMNRCQLLAEAIVTAAERGHRDPAARLATVVERFLREGIDLDAPYLNPGSADRYGFPVT
jgi:HopA1 effector protein family